MKWRPSSPDSDCVFSNGAGVQYEDFVCLHPDKEWAYNRFELTFNPVPIRDWMVDHPVVPIAAVVLYGVLIFAGKRYFAERKPWDWRNAMAAWNLGLSLFSLMGVIRVAPKLLHNIMNYSLVENFCVDPESHYGSDSTGLWMLLFVLSKFVELFDTFFIVIHKKPLIFLHWYHHLSVLLICWYSYVSKSPTGILFGVVNYAVHSVMYFYYFLMAVKCKPKAFKAVYITVAQISQMVVGLTATAVGFHLLQSGAADDGSGVSCFLTRQQNIAVLVMYGSYLFLFVEFFLKRYTCKQIPIKSALRKKKKA